MASTAEIFNRYDIPESIWGPIMNLESGGNPTLRNLTTKEDSVGLFQLNRMGGLGTGYTVAQLQDPSFNANIAAGAMAPAYHTGVSQGLTGTDLLRYVAYNSGWPTKQGVDAVNSDPIVAAYDKRLTGGGVIPVGTASSETLGANDSTLSKILFLVLGVGVVFLGIATMTKNYTPDIVHIETHKGEAL